MILEKTNGRTLAFTIIGLWIASFATALLWIGSDRAVAFVISEPMGRTYADLRLFPSTRQEFANGGNPYVANPSDHWGRLYNYPRLWMSFMRFPESWVPLLGTALIVAWLAGLGAWWGALTWRQGLAGGLLACSPPVILGLERGNTDLIVFLILLFALAALSQKRLIWFCVITFGAFALKLYPAVALLCLLRKGWGRAIPRLAVSMGVCAAYVIIFRDEFSLALGTTAKSMFSSYGSTIWLYVVTYLINLTSDKVYSAAPLVFHFKLLAACLSLGAFTAGWRKSRGGENPPTDRHLEGFWLGATIFTATFVVSISFDYRLIFLLLCVPWLWRKDASDPLETIRAKAIASVTLFGCLWLNPHWWLPLIHLRELCTWGLMISLAWLLGSTCPCVPQYWKFPRVFLRHRSPAPAVHSHIPT